MSGRLPLFPMETRTMSERRQYTLYYLPFTKSDEPWHWLIAADPFPTHAEAEAEKARQEALSGGLHRYKIVNEPEGWGE